jgi:hypothetical protein
VFGEKPFRLAPRHYTSTADVERVAMACGALDVAEIDLFRLAFARWFGRRGADPEIEPAFMRYLKTGQVPPWVRHLAREVVDLASRGILDRGRYGLPAAPDVMAGEFLDRYSRLIVAVAFAAFLAIVSLTQRL